MLGEVTRTGGDSHPGFEQARAADPAPCDGVSGVLETYGNCGWATHLLSLADGYPVGGDHKAEFQEAECQG
jgi:hypothetical protein